MLDWDKPLSQQAWYQNTPSYDDLLATVKAEGRKPTKQEILLAKIKSPQSLLYDSMAGQQLYSNLGKNAHEAAAAAKEYGIPGIRYLDGGSRNTSSGELIGVAQGSGGWQAKIRKTPSGQVGDIIPMANSFTTSKPFPTEQAARDWANSQIGGGTSNFVVFPGNEGLLSILERNGQPIK